MDGYPAHSGRSVTEWLNRHRWYGSVRWPARSPDLTPLDFYVWGKMKTMAYSEPIEARNQLLQRIIDKFHEMRIKEVEVLAAAADVC